MPGQRADVRRVRSSRYALAAPEKGRVKITDIRTMLVQGPRSYLFVTVVTDSGVSGIGEAYGSPAVGVREAIQEIRSNLIGKDPLEIETLYVGLGARTDGSAPSGGVRR